MEAEECAVEDVMNNRWPYKHSAASAPTSPMFLSSTPPINNGAAEVTAPTERDEHVPRAAAQTWGSCVGYGIHPFNSYSLLPPSTDVVWCKQGYLQCLFLSACVDRHCQPNPIADRLSQMGRP